MTALDLHGMGKMCRYNDPPTSEHKQGGNTSLCMPSVEDPTKGHAFAARKNKLGSLRNRVIAVTVGVRTYCATKRRGEAGC